MDEPSPSARLAELPPPPYLYELHPIGWRDPMRWLALGWQDLLRLPWHTLVYGLCFAAMALVVQRVFLHLPQYTMSAISGSLLIGPFLALGLYDGSRRLQRGEPVSLAKSLLCWRPHTRNLGTLVMILVVLELLWGRASLVVFAVSFDTGLPSNTGVLEVIFNPENIGFVFVYLIVGGFFAGLIYASTVVAIPLILDHDLDAITACLRSFHVFLHKTPVMVAWGACIVALVLLALWPYCMGLLVVGPWLGYASWHAYRGMLTVRANPDFIAPAPKA